VSGLASTVGAADGAPNDVPAAAFKQWRRTHSFRMNKLHGRDHEVRPARKSSQTALNALEFSSG
jgi:hypothetical protein